MSAEDLIRTRIISGCRSGRLPRSISAMRAGHQVPFSDECSSPAESRKPPKTGRCGGCRRTARTRPKDRPVSHPEIKIPKFDARRGFRDDGRPEAPHAYRLRSRLDRRQEVRPPERRPDQGRLRADLHRHRQRGQSRARAWSRPWPLPARGTPSSSGSSTASAGRSATSSSPSPTSAAGGSRSAAFRRASTRQPAAASSSSTCSRRWPSSSGISSAERPRLPNESPLTS